MVLGFASNTIEIIQMGLMCGEIAAEQLHGQQFFDGRVTGEGYDSIFVCIISLLSQIILICFNQNRQKIMKLLRDKFRKP